MNWKRTLLITAIGAFIGTLLAMMAYNALIKPQVKVYTGHFSIRYRPAELRPGKSQFIGLAGWGKPQGCYTITANILWYSTWNGKWVREEIGSNKEVLSSRIENFSIMFSTPPAASPPDDKRVFIDIYMKAPSGEIIDRLGIAYPTESS